MHSLLLKKLLEIQNSQLVVKKRRENKFTKSFYASLDDVLEVLLPVLNQHGIHLSFSTSTYTTADEIPVFEMDMNLAILVTRLRDLEEGFISHTVSSVPLPVGVDSQVQGKAMTYAKRQMVVAFFCIRGVEEDDDGNDPWRQYIDEDVAKQILRMLDEDRGEEFAEAWHELTQGEQLAFGPYVSAAYPGGVSKAKQKMRDYLEAARAKERGDA